MEGYEFIKDKGHVTCKVRNDGKTVSTCTLSISVNERKWEVSYRNTCDGYKHLGYGKSSMGRVLEKAMEIYGMPEHIHYIWNGANEYVLEWMEKYFDAKCSCPSRHTTSVSTVSPGLHCSNPFSVLSPFSMSSSRSITSLLIRSVSTTNVTPIFFIFPLE